MKALPRTNRIGRHRDDAVRDSTGPPATPHVRVPNNAKELLDAAANAAAEQCGDPVARQRSNRPARRSRSRAGDRGYRDRALSGFISSRPVAVGEYVSSASIVATIIRTNPIKVQIQVAEADVPSISIGRGVSLEVEALTKTGDSPEPFRR